MTCGLPATKRSSAARSLHSLLHHGAQPTAASGASLGFQRQDISHLRQFMAFAQQQQHARPTSQQPDPCGTNSPTALLSCMRLDDAASMQQALYKLYSHQPAVLCDLLLHFITTLSQLPAPGSTSTPACGGAGVSLSTLEHKLRRLAAFIKHAQAQAQAQPPLTPAVPAAAAAAAAAQAASAAAPPSTDDDAPKGTVGAAATAAMQPSAMQQAAGGCASDAHPTSSMQQHVNLLDRYHPIWSRLHDALKAVEQAQPHSRAPRGKRRRPAGDTHSTGEEQQQQPASPAKRFAPGTSSSAHSTCSLHQTEGSASQEGCTPHQQGGTPPDGCPSHASHSIDAAAEAGVSRLCPTHPESGGGGAVAVDLQTQLSTRELRGRAACAPKLGAAAAGERQQQQQQQQQAAPWPVASMEPGRIFDFADATNMAAYPVVMLGAAPMLMLPGMGLGLGMAMSPLLPMPMLLGVNHLDPAHPVVAASVAAAAAAEIQAAALAACAPPPWWALPSGCRPMPHGPPGSNAPRLSTAPPPPLVPVPAATALPHIFRPLARLPGAPPPAHQAPPACHARPACRTTPACQVGAPQSTAGTGKPSAATGPAAEVGVAGDVQHGGTAPVTSHPDQPAGPVGPALPQATEGAADQPAAPALRQTAEAVLGLAAGPVCRADCIANAATGGKADAGVQAAAGTEADAGTGAAAGGQAIAVVEATGSDAPADRPADLPAFPKADLLSGPAADTPAGLKADAPAGHPAPAAGSTLPCTTAPSSFVRFPGPAVKDLLPPGLLPPHHAMQSGGKTLVGTAAAAHTTVLPGPPVKDLLPLNLVPPRTALARSRAVRADPRKASAAAATAAAAAAVPGVAAGAVAKGAGCSLRPAPAAGAAAAIALHRAALLQRYLPERNRQLQGKQQVSGAVLP